MKDTHLDHPKDRITRIIKRIYQSGLTTTSGGNISIKDVAGNIWVTPSAVDKGSLTRKDIMCVKPDGEVIGLHRPSSEFPFHKAIYDIRPDIHAIIHAHPPALVSFSIVRKIPNTNIIPQAKSICGPIGYAEYALPGGMELGHKIADEFSRGYDAVTMENHGPWSFDRSQTGKLPDFDTAGYNLPDSLELQLRRYIYHAQNAAAMAGCIIDELAQSERPGALLFLGDHAPAMAEVFAAFGVDNPWREPALRTVPYLLWHNEATPARQVHNIVSALPAALLKTAGLPLDDFLLTSDHLREHCIQAQPGDRAACPESPADALLTLSKRRLYPMQITGEIQQGMH
jgi:ribulose-5-phosphate 4-epimerase/fuculose-1-phosphate aldolase